MSMKFLLTTSFLFILSFSVYSQSRSPAVENEFILESETMARNIKSFTSQESTSNMSALTLFSIFAFLAMPLGVYLIFEKQEIEKEKAHLKNNVILMSEYQSSKTRIHTEGQKSTESGEDLEDTDQAA